MLYNPFDFSALDGKELCEGDMVRVISDYPGSEVDHYDGQVGTVRRRVYDNNSLPCVQVYLDKLNVNALFYPHELIHDNDGF